MEISFLSCVLPVIVLFRLLRGHAPCGFSNQRPVQLVAAFTEGLLETRPESKDTFRCPFVDRRHDRFSRIRNLVKFALIKTILFKTVVTKKPDESLGFVLGVAHWVIISELGSSRRTS